MNSDRFLRSRRGAAVVVALAGSLSLMAGAVSAAAAAPRPGLDPGALQKAIDIKKGDQLAGVVARVQDGASVWAGQSPDTVTGRPIPLNSHFRIGSISKTFEATVALQLVAEHRLGLGLGQTIQHYMPGMLPAPSPSRPGGFHPITVRELLDMTSGLPAVDEGAPDQTADQVIAHRFDYQSLDQIIQGTVRPAGRPWPGPHFEPGAKQEYNSLNYRIVAELIEKRTGHPFAAEVSRRILRPLHMTQTFSADHVRPMPGPYLHGYVPDGKGRLVDVSRQAGDASSMISTPRDIDRFYAALFGGRLLGPAQFGQMLTVPKVNYVDGSDCVIGAGKGKACYGLGLQRVAFDGGTVVWGKTGHDLGYASGYFATLDLRKRMLYADAQTQLNGGAPATALRLAQAMGLI